MISRTDQKSQPSRHALEEAASWFVRLQEESASTQTFADWQKWLSAASAHRVAYDEIENTVLRLQRVAVLPTLPSRAEMQADTYDGSVAISSWQNGAPEPRRRVLWRARRPNAWRAAIAAGLSVVILASAWLWPRLAGEQPQLGELAYRTAPGERRVIELPEGSQVTLDADSALRVHLTRERRALTLSAGEAYFQVAKDAARPFVVRAGATQVTAVGTAFNVRTSENRTVVAVVEGEVEVVGTPGQTVTGSTVRARDGRGRHQPQLSPEASGTPQLSARVAAGEAVFYGDGGNLLHVLPAAEASLATAWINGRRQYLQEPLRYVLADIDRYTGRHVELADEETGELRFTGTLNLENSTAWLRGLSVALPVTMTERPDGTLYIARTTPH